MASDRKIAANRRNSRRSSGPRTVAVKLTVSRNALRHGLAAATLRDAGIAAEVDRLATAIGGEHADAAQREQALIIAESELTCGFAAQGPAYFNRCCSRRVPQMPKNQASQLLGRQPAGVIGSSHLDQLRRLE